jgi:hypothetical protein
MFHEKEHPSHVTIMNIEADGIPCRETLPVSRPCPDLLAVPKLL